MTIKCINIFNSKALQNLPKFGCFGLKTNHLASIKLCKTRHANAILMSEFSLCKSHKAIICMIPPSTLHAKKHCLDSKHMYYVVWSKMMHVTFALISFMSRNHLCLANFTQKPQCQCLL
jgi:hypothetical protein